MTLTDLARSSHLKRRLRGVVALSDWQALAPVEQERLFGLGWVPAIGGADDGDDDAGDDSDDDSADDSDDADDAGAKKPAAKKAPAKKAPAKPAADADDDADDDDDADATDPKDKEIRGLKRRLSEESKAKKRLERAAAKAQRDQDVADGEFKRLYEAEKTRADGLESRLKNGSRDRTIIEQAVRLKFHAPKSAIKLVADDLPDDVVDEDGDVDEGAIEKALKALLKREPHHAAAPDAIQGDDAGRGDRQRRSNGLLDDDKMDPQARLRNAYAREGRRRSAA